MLPISIGEIPRIGALQDASYAVEPMTAGAQARITVRFIPRMTLLPGEVIRIRLTDFTGPPFAVLNTTTIQRVQGVRVTTQAVERGEWSLASETVTLFVRSTIPFLRETDIVIPEFLNDANPRGPAPLTGTAVTAALLLATAAAVCAQDPALKAAVVKCVTEEPTGNCACAGTSCSTDARFQGPIGTWDVSRVRNMEMLFYTGNTHACSIYCDFNGNISAWDTSSVKKVDHM